MATRKTARRTSNGKKPQASKRGSHKKSKGGGGILWLMLALVVIAGGILLAMQAKELYKEEMLEGITIDGMDVSGMTEGQALDKVQKAADSKLDNISIVFRYNDKTWNFDAEDLQAHIVADEVVSQAYNTGKEGSVFERYKVYQETKSQGLVFKTSFNVDRDVLVEALADVKKEIDQPMIEPQIVFDATDIGYDEVMDPEFDEVAAMFEITPGSVGYDMDYDKAITDLNEQLAESWTADITLSVIESHPTVSTEELKECTTLIYHASSPITSSNRKIPERNRNIEKAIGFYKSMVVEPGQTVSYNETLGERTAEAGWEKAPIIARDKSVKYELGGGICQAATTIFNAVYRAGATLIQNNPHSWRAYYDPFDYAMDAMINYGTSDMIFKNDSEYPMFINTYMWYNPTTGIPGYVDVDIYTMPQKDENGNILHIRPESTQIRTEPAPPMVYQEVGPDTDPEILNSTEWKLDPALGKMILEYVKPRTLYEYEVYRVWYKNCTEEEKGIFSGGEEVKREYSHTYLYKNVAGLTYTKPTPTPPPATATPPPVTTPPPSSPTDGAVG